MIFFLSNNLKRTKRLYKESVYTYAVLEEALRIKGESKGIRVIDTVIKDLDLVKNYTMKDIKKFLLYLIKLGYLEATDDEGYVNITELGIKKLQSRELQIEIANLNIGIQNIYIQILLFLIGGASIILQIVEILCK